MSAVATLEKPSTVLHKVFTEIKRGQVYYADLRGSAVGHEQSGVRPVLILQNNLGNRFAPTVIVAIISSSVTKKNLPTHVLLDAKANGFQRDSLVMLEQIKTIDKDRLLDYICTLNQSVMEQVKEAAQISMAL